MQLRREEQEEKATEERYEQQRSSVDLQVEPHMVFRLVCIGMTRGASFFDNLVTLM